MQGKRLIIIDDDRDVLDALAILLEDEFSQITTIENPNRIETLLREKPDVILLDMNFSAGINTGNEGLFWLDKILTIQPDTVVIMMTAYGTIGLAVEALKRGARDFVLKPWDNEKVISAVRACILTLKRTDSGQREAVQPSVFTGTSPSMIHLRQQIEKVAPTEASVLILGENGTGKEVIARELHRLSKRAERVFLPVDLSTISPGLFESELFGHKKGAFTDARSDHTGRFESANGGTLFLDEIGNLPMAQQAKLLTVLQSRSFTPVGSALTVTTDFRLICATNNIPEDMVRTGTFRQDLLYRINTITMVVPPLRERREDIVPLAEFFIHFYCQKYNREVPRLSQEVRRMLLSYHWPGNVREMQHAMEKSVILFDKNEITTAELHFPDPQNSTSRSSGTLENLERDALARALEQCGGNIVQAAKVLGITRQTLYNKMKKYGL